MTDTPIPECDHEWKFNGGNPMCWKCGTPRDEETRVVVSSTVTIIPTEVRAIKAYVNDLRSKEDRKTKYSEGYSDALFDVLTFIAYHLDGLPGSTTRQSAYGHATSARSDRAT